MGIVPYVDDDTVTNTLARALPSRCKVENWRGRYIMYWRIECKWPTQHYTSVVYLHRDESNQFTLRYAFGRTNLHETLDDVVAELQNFTGLSQTEMRWNARPGVGDCDPAAGPPAGGPRTRGLRQPFTQAKNNHALLTDIICSLHSRVTNLQTGQTAGLTP